MIEKRETTTGTDFNIEQTAPEAKEPEKVSGIEMSSISAEYEFENEPSESGKTKRNKFSYDPQQYDYPEDNTETIEGGKVIKTGYSFTHHGAFDRMEDEAFANHTFLGLVENIDFSRMVVQNEMDIMDLVLFTPLLAPNGNYIRNIDGKLFALTTPTEQLTDKNMFKIYRSKAAYGNNESKYRKNGFVVSQATKFATVKLFMNRFNVEMEDMILDDPEGRQHFDVYQIPGTNRITLNSRLIDPWKIKSIGGETVVPDQFKNVKRFWSLYDADSSDLKIPNWIEGYPKYIYESRIPYPNMIKINGNEHNRKHRGTADHCRFTDDTQTMDRVGNNYLFKAGYFEDNDRFFMLGYDGKIRWVKYYNEFFDKFFNMDVTPDKIIEDVKPSVIFECPYKALMDKDGMKLNFAELKNVMTPGYFYTTKNKGSNQ